MLRFTVTSNHNTSWNYSFDPNLLEFQCEPPICDECSKKYLEIAEEKKKSFVDAEVQLKRGMKTFINAMHSLKQRAAATHELEFSFK